MRPTELRYRSPKEKTAEFNLPVVTNQGRLLFELPPKMKPSFPISKRFDEYQINAKITGHRVGPGAYQQDHYSIARSHVKGGHVYKHYHRNQDLTNNGYIFVGDQLMFDASFLLPSRKHQNQDINATIDASETRRNNKKLKSFHRTSTASNTPSKNERELFRRNKVMSPNFSEFNSSRGSY